MSGSSDQEKCPFCEGAMEVSSDWKPHDFVSGECLECGYLYYMKTGQMSLKEVNEIRKDRELKPIKQFKPRKYQPD